MALTNDDRASDLHPLDLRYRSFSPQGANFEILGLTKTCRSGPPRQAFYPSFPEKCVPCGNYESRTIIHRLTGGVANPLFAAQACASGYNLKMDQKYVQPGEAWSGFEF